MLPTVRKAVAWRWNATWAPAITWGSSTAQILLGEVAFPPFSCVMCMEQPWHGLPVCDITDFAHYTWADITDVDLPLVVGFSHWVMPSDYRSKAAIEHTVAMNEALMAATKRPTS